MTEEKGKSDALQGAAVSGGSTFLGALAVGVPLGVAAVGAAASAAAQAVLALGADSIARRSEKYVSTFRRVLHESHEGDLDAEVLKRVADPDFRNVAHHALRQLRDALDDAVVPAIAVLTKDYTMPEVRRADSFFRDAGDLLCALSGDEYREFAELLTAISEPPLAERCRVSMNRGLPGHLYIDVWPAPLGERPSRYVKNVASGFGPALLGMLQRHGFASDPNEGVFETYDGAGRLSFWRDAVVVDRRIARLHSILDRAHR